MGGGTGADERGGRAHMTGLTSWSPSIWAARKYGLNGGTTAAAPPASEGGRCRAPPIESLVDQIYAAKPYAN